MRFLPIPPISQNYSNRDLLRALALFALILVGCGLMKLSWLFTEVSTRFNRGVDTIAQAMRKT